MTCTRCNSHMVPDAPLQFHAIHADLSELDYLTAYRCVACGNVEDPVILRNRAKQADERRLIAEANTIATYADLRVVA